MIRDPSNGNKIDGFGTTVLWTGLLTFITLVVLCVGAIITGLSDSTTTVDYAVCPMPRYDVVLKMVVVDWYPC